ncbi:hypothetical protein GCM10022206_28950 [Streptomyces chiangmaiensis]
MQGVNLTECAKAQGVHPQTTYRWFREGTLPVPAQRVGLKGLTPEDDTVLRAVGGHLGTPAAKDLKRRCADG